MIAPGALHEGHGIDVDDPRKGQQKYNHTDQIGNGTGAQFGGAVENIDPHVIVAQQRKTGDGGKHCAIEPDIQVLHPDIADGKEVSLYHYGEADNDNGQREPGKDFPDNQVNSAYE